MVKILIYHSLTIPKNKFSDHRVFANRLLFYRSTFLPALKYAKEQGLPVTLHCGEVCLSMWYFLQYNAKP